MCVNTVVAHAGAAQWRRWRRLRQLASSWATADRHGSGRGSAPHRSHGARRPPLPRIAPHGARKIDYRRRRVRSSSHSGSTMFLCRQIRSIMVGRNSGYSDTPLSRSSSTFVLEQVIDVCVPQSDFPAGQNPAAHCAPQCAGGGTVGGSGIQSQDFVEQTCGG